MECLIRLVASVRSVLALSKISKPNFGHQQVRKLIEETLLTDAEFEAFCLDCFPTVHRQFGCSQNHVQKLDLLISAHSAKAIVDALTRTGRLSPHLLGSGHYSDTVRSGVVAKRLRRIGRIGGLAVLVALLIFAKKTYVSDLALPALPRQWTKIAGRQPANEFINGVESLAVEAIGAENISITHHRMFDSALKKTIYYIEIYNRKTNSIAASIILSSDDIKAWIATTPIRHPVVRNFVLSLARELDRSEATPASGEAATVPLLEPKPAQPTAPNVPGPRVPPQPRLPPGVLHPAVPAVPTADLGVAEAELGIPAESKPVPDMSVGAEEPGNPRSYLKILPMIYMKDEFLYREIPRLSDVVKDRFLCSEFTITHKICVDMNGRVTFIEPIVTISDYDSVIVSSLKKWKFKPRPEPVCFVNALNYMVDNGRDCEKVSIDLSEFQIQGKVSVPVKIERISGGDPHLPEHIKNMFRDSVLSAAYKVCISPKGEVVRVEPQKSIDRRAGQTGGDSAIIETVYRWKYKPIPTMSCYLQRFEYFIS